MGWPPIRLIIIGMQLCLLYNLHIGYVLAIESENVDMSNRSNCAIPEQEYLTKNVCGVICVYAVLKDFGIAKDYADILAKMPPGIYGNSMKQIVEYLPSNSSLRVKPILCDGDILYHELNRRNNQKAIIHFADHWVFLRNASNNTFEIIDFPRKYFIPVDVIDSLWDGYAVIVYKRSLLSKCRWFATRILVIFALGIIVLILCKQLSKHMFFRQACMK